jgi:hypothetical protein
MSVATELNVAPKGSQSADVLDGSPQVAESFFAAFLVM